MLKGQKPAPSIIEKRYHLSKELRFEENLVPLYMLNYILNYLITVMFLVILPSSRKKEGLVRVGLHVTIR